jgi:uncharacterized protein (TIGR02145 family)
MIINKPIESIWLGSARLYVIYAMLAAWLLPVGLFGQTEPSALLEIQSTDKGFLMPRMTQAQRDAIQQPATALMIYNTSSACVDINFGIPSAPQWQGLTCQQGSIFAFNCANATQTGTLMAGFPANGVSVLIPYMGVNGGPHNGQTVTSSGVLGLTATLSAGTFPTGAGNLSYNISGIPATTGTASFALSIGGQSCTLTLTVEGGSINSLNCTSATQTGTLTTGVAVSGVSVQVPYTDGNGGPHAGQVVTSTGVTGLTATLSAGDFAVGDSSLSYVITGTPSSNGTAFFTLTIVGHSCTLPVHVSTGCWAQVSATDVLEFMCHNLGAANTGANPFIPSWEINGGYWQWGRMGPGETQWLNTNTENFAHGPMGFILTNEAAISGWSTTAAMNGSWQDATKTANDPCPAGFRVPTKAEWDAVTAYNTINNVGSWWDTATNYSSANTFGSDLLLPAAGFRRNTDGALLYRGSYGYYWSSTEDGTGNAWLLQVNSGNPYTYTGSRLLGRSIRCAVE